MKFVCNLYKYTCFVLLLTMAVNSTMAGEPWADKKKTYSKTFSLDGVSLFELENQFGEVRVETITANEARVEIEMIASAKSESEAQNLLDKISIAESTGSVLKLETKLDRFNGVNGSRKIAINYKVWVPNNIAIKFQNQFGDMHIPDWKGSSTLISKFGELYTGNLAANQEVKVEFGKMFVKSVTDGRINGQYSKVEISGINGNVRANFDFCSSPQVTVGDKFESLNVSNSYSSMKLLVPPDYKGKFDIRTSFSNLKNNSAFAIKEDKLPDEKGPRFDKDYLGQAGSDSTIIKVKSSFGDVTIKN